MRETRRLKKWFSRDKDLFPEDVTRIVRVLGEVGVVVSRTEAATAWAAYSEEEYCAGWMDLPTSDESIVDALTEPGEPTPPPLALTDEERDWVHEAACVCDTDANEATLDRHRDYYRSIADGLRALLDRATTMDDDAGGTHG